jgi:two-component system, OmpR family, phosphate regulon sensor histidine kinase PhoR
LKTTSRALFQFYVLVVYVLLQFSWWAYLIASLNSEVHDLKLREINTRGGENISLSKDELDKKLNQRLLMIFGEGSVFIIILSLGIVQTRKTFKKEAELVRQHRNFLMSVTHELKSPLASMKLQIETLIKRKLNEEQSSTILHHALKETERLDMLVEKVLMANKFEDSNLPIQLETIHLSELIHRTINIASKSYLAEHLYSVSCPEDLRVQTDPLALTSILNNLLENASKYSEPGTMIELSIQVNDDSWSLAVSDSGIGIPQDEVQHIFTRFYRIGNEETRQSKGTGLGLYIVKQIAQALQGKIFYKPNQPKGSVFSITFPR